MHSPRCSSGSARPNAFVISAAAALALAAFALTASNAQAVSLHVDGAGILIGASDVLVDGSLYDVVFENGSCDSLYNGCDPSEFAFSSLALAQSAAQALLDQVFIDSALGNFDSQTDMIFGCTFAGNCLTRIPFAAGVGGVSQVVVVNNASGLDSFFDETLGTDNNSAVFGNVNFATAAAVPEPSAAVVFVAGALVVSGALRRR
ncbi:MAG: hypothetical protein JRH19_25470 [Deltaproteobacteria bacterium]|nr:hypothetical protein [Deltaproteobacteria bacterium]